MSGCVSAAVVLMVPDLVRADANSLILVTNAKRITKSQRDLAEKQSIILCLGDSLNAGGAGLVKQLSR